MCSEQWAVCIVQWAVCSVLCAVCSLQCCPGDQDEEGPGGDQHPAGGHGPQPQEETSGRLAGLTEG